MQYTFHQVSKRCNEGMTVVIVPARTTVRKPRAATATRIRSFFEVMALPSFCVSMPLQIVSSSSHCSSIPYETSSYQGCGCQSRARNPSLAWSEKGVERPPETFTRYVHEFPRLSTRGELQKTASPQELFYTICRIAERSTFFPECCWKATFKETGN